MKNIGLLSGRSNKTFRVILVWVKYIEKYGNVNKVRSSAIPSHCMNSMKIIVGVIIFLHLSTRGKLLSRMLTANLYFYYAEVLRLAAEFEICRPQKSFHVAYFQFYNTAFYRRPLPA